MELSPVEWEDLRLLGPMVQCNLREDEDMIDEDRVW